jgi:hypothetical protein
MFSSNSNFTETKDLALTIVVKCDLATFTLIPLKGCDLCIHYRALNLYHQRSKPTQQIRLLF